MHKPRVYLIPIRDSYFSHYTLFMFYSMHTNFSSVCACICWDANCNASTAKVQRQRHGMGRNCSETEKHTAIQKHTYARWTRPKAAVMPKCTANKNCGRLCVCVRACNIETCSCILCIRCTRSQPTKRRNYLMWTVSKEPFLCENKANQKNWLKWRQETR